tara:strand:+ start:4429 stop:4647 length:219 start_codon:yes stop_codon:yes gene_type:complete
MREQTKVVIRYLSIFEKWFICHEKSYQSAFSRDYNGFETRDKAVEFAESNDLEVVFHEHDKLQKAPEQKESA